LKDTFTPLRLIILGVLAMGGCRSPAQGTAVSEQQPDVETATFGRNASFTIDGTPVTLVDGVSEVPIPGSSSRTTTRYLGPEADGDLNGDGLEDLAFWISHDAGGSGTFYYVVVALGMVPGYKTTNAFFVGDRITPQSIQVRADAQELHVNFVGRTSNAPMAAPPSEPGVLILRATPDGLLTGVMSP
jgi:hypothetical protein